jgi:hypothetical protein
MVRKGFVSMNLVIILVVALIHTFIHYSVFSDISSSNNGISGFSVTEIDKKDSATFTLSLLIIGFEWATLIFLMIFTFFREKVEVKPEAKIKIDREKMRKISLSGTEIDMLYEVLKNNNSIKVSSAARLFGVEKDDVMLWAKTLSDANLAYVNYPRMGEAEIVVK